MAHEHESAESIQSKLEKGLDPKVLYFADKLTKKLTGFGSFIEMLKAYDKDSYVPTLISKNQDDDITLLADIYDMAQEIRGNKARAWRGHDKKAEVVNSLVKIANELDERGQSEVSDKIDAVIKALLN
jgi:hypothetical protein